MDLLDAWKSPLTIKRKRKTNGVIFSFDTEKSPTLISFLSYFFKMLNKQCFNRGILWEISFHGPEVLLHLGRMFGDSVNFFILDNSGL